MQINEERTKFMVWEDKIYEDSRDLRNDADKKKTHSVNEVKDLST